MPASVRGASVSGRSQLRHFKAGTCCLATSVGSRSSSLSPARRAAISSISSRSTLLFNCRSILPRSALLCCIDASCDPSSVRASLSSGTFWPMSELWEESSASRPSTDERASTRRFSRALTSSRDAPAGPLNFSTRSNVSVPVSKDSIEGRSAASETAFAALKSELRAFTQASEGIRKDAARCRDAARKADEVLERARRARNFIGATEKQQRPSLGETDQDEVTAAPGWDAMGTRRSSDDPELADHLARRDKAIAMGLVDAPPDEWMEEERPEEPETEAERKLRELEERAFDGAAVQDEEAAPWPRAESLAQSAAPWNHARQRDRAARGLPPPAPLPLEIPEPSDHTTAHGERTPGAPRPDPQATIDATAAYLQMRRDRAATSVPRTAAATPPPPSESAGDDDAAARDESLEDAFGAMYASRPPAGAGSAPARARRRGRPLPQTSRS